MRQTIQEKALDYLQEGRIQVVRADRHSIVLEVQGSDKHPYQAVFSAGMWSCSCPARVQECAHVLAACLISPFRNSEAEIEMPAEASDLDELFAL